jgi:hypothetical protein
MSDPTAVLVAERDHALLDELIDQCTSFAAWSQANGPGPERAA